MVLSRGNRVSSTRATVGDAAANLIDSLLPGAQRFLAAGTSHLARGRAGSEAECLRIPACPGRKSGGLELLADPFPLLEAKRVLRAGTPGRVRIRAFARQFAGWPKVHAVVPGSCPCRIPRAKSSAAIDSRCRLKLRPRSAATRSTFSTLCCCGSSRYSASPSNAVRLSASSLRGLAGAFDRSYRGRRSR